MERSSLVKSMRQMLGTGMITRKDLAAFMGIKDPHNVDKYLAPLEGVNGKYYLIEDVADQLISQVR